VVGSFVRFLKAAV